MSDCQRLEQAVAALEAQRSALGDDVVDAALVPLRRQLVELKAASAEPGAALAGERKLVTVMFADISGFTALAETMDPEAARDLMNACFECLVPVVEKYEGTIDKFMGDGIMALFGAPVAHENDAERALRAALEMRDELAQLNAERHTDLGVHFGINTGLVIAGGLGTRGRQEYSVVGDAVNLAARLEEASERGEVLAGPDTHRLTGPLFEFEPLAPIRMKGRADPVVVYRVLAARAGPGKARGIAGLDSPLVGRDEELHVLQQAVERLRSGQGGIVTVAGEAGLGKSRLVAELRKQALGKSSDDPQWVEGRCLSHATSIAYLLWTDVLHGLLGVDPESGPQEVREALQEAARARCPDHAEAVCAYVGQVLALPTESPDEAALRGWKAERLKERTFHAIEALLTGVACKRPLVVVCEDLHWVDPTSMELLERLLQSTATAPLLLLCVFRPDASHGPWHLRAAAAGDHADRHTDVVLEPLSADESEALTGQLLRMDELPDWLKERVLGRAEGNPLFVEEIIRALMGLGALVRDDASGRWEAADAVPEVAVPDTLIGVLTARIDRLPEGAKRVLQLAAVVGRIVPRGVLHDIAGEEGDLEEHLSVLQQEGMIRERVQAPGPEYIFKHQLTQDAAYMGILHQERRVLHRRCAGALEELFPDRVEEQIGLLAYHWEHADEPRKAAEYLLRAGDQARSTYAQQEAIDYYQRGLAVVGDALAQESGQGWRQELGAGLGEGLGDVLAAGARYEEASAVYREALAEAPVGDTDRQARLHRKAGSAWREQRQFAQAVEGYDAAEVALGEQSAQRSAEWWREWLQIQHDRVLLHYFRREPDEMARLAEATRPVLEQHGTAAQRAAFFEWLSGMYMQRDRYVTSPEALESAEAALRAGRESGDLGHIAECGSAVGFTRLWRGDLDAAEKQLSSSLELAERIGDVALQARCLAYLGIVQRKRGDVEETRRCSRRALPLTEATGVAFYGEVAKANLAWADWVSGDLAGAREKGTSALALLPPVYPFRWTALWPLIGVALAEDEMAEAIEHARALLDAMHQRLPDPLTEALGGALTAWDEGKPAEAKGRLESALNLAREFRCV